MMSALHVASARLSFLWILCLNDLIDGNLCRNIFYIHVFFLFWFSNVILSVALILPVSQLQRERASESLIRSHIEYLIQTYYIDTDSTQHVRPPGFSTACGLTAWDNTEPRDPKPVWTCFQALIKNLTVRAVYLLAAGGSHPLIMRYTGWSKNVATTKSSKKLLNRIKACRWD